MTDRRHGPPPIGMKQNITLTIFAFLSLVLSLIHITQDTMFDKAGVDKMGTAIILAIMIVYLYGITELAGKRAGYAIMVLGGLASAYMPFLHSMGPIGTAKGIGFIFVLFAMGTTGIFSAILAARQFVRSLQPMSSS